MKTMGIIIIIIGIIRFLIGYFDYSWDPRNASGLFVIEALLLIIVGCLLIIGKGMIKKDKG